MTDKKEEPKNIYTQLFALQNEIGAIAKTETNPFYKSKYFDINGLLEQLKPLLEKHKLVVIQPLTDTNGKPAIKTVVASIASSDEIVSIVPLPENPDPQKMGAIISYFRRYALQSLFLLQAEDNDAQDAVPVLNTTPAPQYSPSAPTLVIKCANCGGDKIHNPKTGKIFCKAKCWLQPKQEPVVDYNEPPFV